MTDKETRERILNDPRLPIHREYNGVQTRKDVLEALLMGYSAEEIAPYLGMHRSSVCSTLKRLRAYFGYERTSEMVRGLVKQYRGYL